MRTVVATYQHQDSSLVPWVVELSPSDTTLIRYSTDPGRERP